MRNLESDSEFLKYTIKSPIFQAFYLIIFKKTPQQFSHSLNRLRLLLSDSSNLTVFLLFEAAVAGELRLVAKQIVPSFIPQDFFLTFFVFLCLTDIRWQCNVLY